MYNRKKEQLITQECKEMFDTIIAEGAKTRFADITNMYFNYYYNTEEYSRLVEEVLEVCSKITDVEIWADTYFYVSKMFVNARGER